jgi:ArsR family transcriptional regulator
MLSTADKRAADDVSTALTAKYFRALGDPTRLRILELLMNGALTVTELTQILRVPQSSVSNHLACLRWCGFVASESRGKWTHYTVSDPKIRTLVECGRALVNANAEHVAACTRIASTDRS